MLADANLVTIGTPFHYPPAPSGRGDYARMSHGANGNVFYTWVDYVPVFPMSCCLIPSEVRVVVVSCILTTCDNNIPDLEHKYNVIARTIMSFDVSRGLVVVFRLS